MSLWDKLRGELIDIIEWTEPGDSDLLAYRFPRYDNEIKYGAKLTVREDRCTGCGECVEVCPVDAITVAGGRGKPGRGTGPDAG